MKALVGAWDTRPRNVMAEMASLRGRIKELEQELARSRAENAALSALLDSGVEPDIEIALTATASH